MGKCLKPIQKAKKENVNFATQVNRNYVASRSLTQSTFPIYQAQQLYTIFNKLNCKSKFIIYLMESVSCKVQYVRKAEAAF